MRSLIYKQVMSPASVIKIKGLTLNIGQTAQMSKWKNKVISDEKKESKGNTQIIFYEKTYLYANDKGTKLSL